CGALHLVATSRLGRRPQTASGLMRSPVLHTLPRLSAPRRDRSTAASRQRSDREQRVATPVKATLEARATPAPGRREPTRRPPPPALSAGWVEAEPAVRSLLERLLQCLTGGEGEETACLGCHIRHDGRVVRVAVQPHGDAAAWKDLVPGGVRGGAAGPL